jgi:hypothetical protein
MKNKMRRITINIECCKKECGRCRYTRYINNTVMKSRYWACDIFKVVLDNIPKSGDTRRCKECLEGEQRSEKH